jgi:hypothetical protein
MEQRIQEMKERRKRLIKILYKKEGRLSEYEQGFKTLVQRKNQIVKKYTVDQIELVLRQTAMNPNNNNLGLDVINTLIPLHNQDTKGLLAEMNGVFSFDNSED